ncbi:MAG: universal stress protein [Acidimicrobiales bacterium]
MNQVVVLCVDGSDTSIGAAATGLARLAPAYRTIVATVVDASDPMLVTGVSGMAGGAMSPEQVDELNAAHSAHGEAVVQAALAALDLPGAETQVLMGEPATELGLFAQEVGATVLVVGSRGHGALKQAFLGSVSAHLVRNAPCPVLVVRDDVED